MVFMAAMNLLVRDGRNGRDTSVRLDSNSLFVEWILLVIWLWPLYDGDLFRICWVLSDDICCFSIVHCRIFIDSFCPKLR